MRCNRAFRRRGLIFSFIVICVIGLVWLTEVLVKPWIEDALIRPLLAGVLNGALSFGYLSESLVQHHEQQPEVRTLEFYVKGITGAGFRSVYLGGVLALVGVCAVIWREQVLPSARGFWVGPERPVNLAVFRIALFGTLFVHLLVTRERLLFFSTFPDELLVPPGCLGGVIAGMPRGEALSGVLCFIGKVCCVTGVLGLFTRASAGVLAVVVLYLLGIPQLFGKVNHYHHFYWFLTIVALGPVSSMLSIDGLRAACRRADRGEVGPPGPSVACALVLRFVVVLIGLLYFFPGFWKWVVGGPQWVVSDHLRYVLYSAWSEDILWDPIVRLDRYYPLLVVGALGTILFELGVIFAVFFRRGRVWAGVAGLVFHNMTAVTMRVNFWSLQTLYVVFFDWLGVFARIGKRLFRERVRVIYDGHGRGCRRVVAMLNVIDLFGRMEYEEAAGSDRADRAGLAGGGGCSPVAGVCVVGGGRRWEGYAAWGAIARRVPVLWPVLPLLWLGPGLEVGRRVCAGVAGSRLCGVLDGIWVAGPGGERDRASRGLIGFGIAAIFLMVWYGVNHQTAAWPFACYPTFDGVMRTPVRSVIVVEAAGAGGRPIPWDDALINGAFRPDRYRGLMDSILRVKEPVARDVRLREFWSVLSRVDPALAGARTVRFYRTTISTDPADRGDWVIDRALLLEFQLAGGGVVSE